MQKKQYNSTVFVFKNAYAAVRREDQLSQEVCTGRLSNLRDALHCVTKIIALIY